MKKINNRAEVDKDRLSRIQEKFISMKTNLIKERNSLGKELLDMINQDLDENSSSSQYILTVVELKCLNDQIKKLNN